MLSGQQIGFLRDRIIEVYSKQEFEDFLLTRLDKRYELLAEENNYRFEVREIVSNASTRYWLDELLIELQAENPKNPKLTKLIFDLGVGFGAYNGATTGNIASTDALQNIVNAIPLQFTDVILEGITSNKKCICRIEYATPDGNCFGTGFLIGPDIILTNYHVVERLINSPGLAPGVTCLFDYEAKADGTIVYPGTRVQLHQDFLVAHSPYSSLDKAGTASLNDGWPDDQLDYAVLRLAQKIGDEPITLKHGATDNAPARAWIKPAGNNAVLMRGGHMHIMQHPDGRPLQIAMGFQKIIGLSSNGSRVRYEINTLKGSSGSPCFNEKFEWVALHNLGDPSWVPTFNQGITASSIVRDLQRFNVTLN